MTSTEIAKIRACRQSIASIVNAKSRSFILDMSSLADDKPYWNLSDGRATYLNNIYTDLVAKGMISNPVEEVVA